MAKSAPWQIEVDKGEGEPADYYSVKALKLSGTSLIMVTNDGDQVNLKSDKLRKILIMRTQRADDS